MLAILRHGRLGSGSLIRVCGRFGQPKPRPLYVSVQSLSSTSTEGDQEPSEGDQEPSPESPPKARSPQVEKDHLFVVRGLNKAIKSREWLAHRTFEGSLPARVRSWLMGATGRQQMCIFNSHLMYKSLKNYVELNKGIFYHSRFHRGVFPLFKC